MTYPRPPAPHPSRPSRYWVHAVPVIAIVASLAISAFFGADMFNEANNDVVNRPAAPYAAFFMWLAWFLLLGAIGTFLTFLAYLLVLPARSRGLWITQIVLTSIAGLFAIIAVVLITRALPNM